MEFSVFGFLDEATQNVERFLVVVKQAVRYVFEIVAEQKQQVRVFDVQVNGALLRVDDLQKAIRVPEKPLQFAAKRRNRIFEHAVAVFAVPLDHPLHNVEALGKRERRGLRQKRNVLAFQKSGHGRQREDEHRLGRAQPGLYGLDARLRFAFFPLRQHDFPFILGQQRKERHRRVEHHRLFAGVGDNRIKIIELVLHVGNRNHERMDDFQLVVEMVGERLHDFLLVVKQGGFETGVDLDQGVVRNGVVRKRIGGRAPLIVVVIRVIAGERRVHGQNVLQREKDVFGGELENVLDAQCPVFFHVGTNQMRQHGKRGGHEQPDRIFFAVEKHVEQRLGDGHGAPGDFGGGRQLREHLVSSQAQGAFVFVNRV